MVLIKSTRLTLDGVRLYDCDIRCNEHKKPVERKILLYVDDVEAEYADLKKDLFEISCYPDDVIQIMLDKL